MGAYTKAVSHLSSEEVMERIKSTRGFRNIQKWLVIWNAIVDPRPAVEIANHTGMAKQTVHNIISEYNRKGPQVMERPGRGGRRKAYLGWEEEEQILKGFEDMAITGQVATANDVKRALEEYIGHEVHKSTVYRIMKKHGWRKVVPRPSHVAKDKEKQDDFKKNSPRK